MTILIKIEANKRDFFYEFKKEVNSCLALWGQGQTGRTPDFYAKEALSPFDEYYLRSMRVARLTIRNGAELNLLEDKSLLPYVRSVQLCAGNDNAGHLGILAQNYPNITTLTISQNSKLSKVDASSLQAFKKLKYLHLQCPHEAVDNFWEILPPQLTFLQLEGTSPNLRLSKLEDLRIKRCRVEAAFLETLKTPKLERLRFFQVDLQHGYAAALAQLPLLKELTFHNTNCGDEIESCSKLKYLSICSLVN